MAECIEKEAALDRINQELCCGATADQCGLETAFELLRELPPADVRPVARGRWIEEKWYDLPPSSPIPYLCFAKCSACGKESIVNIKRGRTEWEIDSDICPRCGSYNGADMRGGDSE